MVPIYADYKNHGRYIWVQQTTLRSFSSFPDLKLVIRQRLGVKGLRVEIVSFVLFLVAVFFKKEYCFFCFNF